eukprot:4317355-Prymnesium_polylepis.1
MAVGAEMKRLQDELSQAHSGAVAMDAALRRAEEGASRAAADSAEALNVARGRAETAGGRAAQLESRLAEVEVAYARACEEGAAASSAVEALTAREVALRAALDEKGEALRLEGAQKEVRETLRRAPPPRWALLTLPLRPPFSVL